MLHGGDTLLSRTYHEEMPISCGFNHIATLTTDLDRFAAFYVDVFDATVTFTMEATTDHPRMFIIDVGGGAALNVFEVPAESIVGDRRRLGDRGAIDHFAIAVDSLDTLEHVRDRLIAASADTGAIQRLGGDTWSLFFRDIDGMELEVCAPADHPH
jgi:catechol 2,3-dioxygenase-like lactoylglutathione lyase family enzyme